MAFAMLPLGAEIAVTAVSLLLLVQGFGVLPVLALFVFGMAVTIIGDNFVWPALVGRSARLPFLLALIGVLGGVQAFGLIGLFIGPVIMAVVLVIWREWIAPREISSTGFPLARGMSAGKPRVTFRSIAPMPAIRQGSAEWETIQ